MKRYIGIIIFITLFISILSIIAILIARGYNFTGSEITESGIVNIVSTPEDAKIFINGEEKGVTPKKIELVSGEYEINISKDGYEDWKKEIKVEPSIVTDVSLTLFPVELNLEQITFTEIDRAFFSNDGSLALYLVSKEPNKGIWLSKLEKSIFEISSPQAQKILELDAIPQECINNKKYVFTVSSDNTKSILECILEDYTLFLLLDIQNSNTPIININQEIGFNPNIVNFSFNNDNLFITDSEIVINYSITSKQLSLISRKKDNLIPQLSPFGDDVLLIENSYDNTTQSILKLGSDLKKTIINLPEEIKIDTKTEISGSKNNTKVFALSTSQGSYILNTEQANSSSFKQFSQSQVNIIDWSYDGESFFFKENNQLISAVIKSDYTGNMQVKLNTLLENYNPSETEVFWTTNSQHILTYNLENTNLNIMDRDGLNERSLFNGELTYPDSFKLSGNETYLLLLLKDDDGYSNLYSIKLKI